MKNDLYDSIFIVNTRNKDTFTNNFNRREIFKVPLNPSDKRGKTREKIPSYLLPLSGELGDLGGWLCIESVSLILTSTIALAAIYRAVSVTIACRENMISSTPQSRWSE